MICGMHYKLDNCINIIMIIILIIDIINESDIIINNLSCIYIYFGNTISYN